ncbi:uncharacterized protein [Palaemon carinicauda]|uniref:uncharacterized protein n=1 Tax=Palaemon carinicauda TaxID=392227 RepID=UPI0035B64689
MSRQILTSAEVHRLSEDSSGEENVISNEKRTQSTADSDMPSNSDIVNMLLQQNQTLMQIIQKRSGSPAKKNEAPPPTKRSRRSPELPESANLDLFSFYNNGDESDYEDFNLLTFNKPIPSYISTNFKAEPSFHREGKIQLNNSLVALTFSEGHSDNRDKFFVSSQNKEFSDFFKLINTPKLNFWPEGKVFDDSYKRKFFYDIENIKMSISAFQGHAALAHIVYPSKVNDIDFLSKIIIGPLRRSIDLIQNLIRNFRSRALPRYLKEEVRDLIIKADIKEVWNLTEDQKSAIAACFHKGPLLRGGAANFRGRKFNFGGRFQGRRFSFLKGNPNFRFKSQPLRRGNRRGGYRGGRSQNGQANSSGAREKKDPRN